MTDDRGEPDDLRIHLGDEELSQVTKPALGAALHGEHPRLALDRGAHEHIQARLLPDGVYELEYRTGEPGERFQLYTSDAVLVRDVLWAWLDGDPWWHDAVAWYPIDPAIAELASVRDELTDLLDGLSVMDDMRSSLDDAFARVDELMNDDLMNDDLMNIDDPE
ncbi:hypothetical protein [Nocardia sp. NPDC052566]|uniref:hypothetical protein n=1 Tax=Nocardia sp. NPDC052566 TaxID=3364330 RepID=UPI0037CB18B0